MELLQQVFIDTYKVPGVRDTAVNTKNQIYSQGARILMRGLIMSNILRPRYWSSMGLSTLFVLSQSPPQTYNVNTIIIPNLQVQILGLSKLTCPDTLAGEPAISTTI